jgi:hypothetical protein
MVAEDIGFRNFVACSPYFIRKCRYIVAEINLKNTNFHKFYKNITPVEDTPPI